MEMKENEWIHDKENWKDRNTNGKYKRKGKRDILVRWLEENVYSTYYCRKNQKA